MHSGYTSQKLRLGNAPLLNATNHLTAADDARKPSCDRSLPLLFECDWSVSIRQHGGLGKNETQVGLVFLLSCDVTAWDSLRIMVHAGKIPLHSDFKQRPPGIQGFLN